MSLINKIIGKLIPTPKHTMVTSFSDNNEYPQFCEIASNDEVVFKTFRSNPIHDGIVDVISEEDGRLLLEYIDLSPEKIEEIEKFKLNDEYGGPRVYQYDKIGLVSPATIRYIKILYDLERLFGSLNGMNIVELGVGYGGQARIICEKFEIKSYSLIDLPQVLKLTQKYLGKFNINNELYFLDKGNLRNVEYDFFISSYAFTELRRSLQEEYLEKVILKSKRGFILYNDINPEDFNSIKKDELLTIIPNAKILPEQPSTSPKNCVIVWGTIV